ncbi:hypothetical protein ACHWQZ_G001136 [Mnemiopsis leidyi]
MIRVDSEKFYDDGVGGEEETVSVISDVLNQCQNYKVSEVNQVISDLHSSCGPGHNDHFSSFFINIDGNASNFDTLLVELERFTHKFSIIALAETNTDQQLKNLYQIPGYNSFYQETIENKAKGTGVAIYVANHLNAEIIENIGGCSPDIESLFIRITLPDNPNTLTCGVVYRPPNSNCETFLSEFNNINSLLPNANVRIMGDFNLDLLKINSMSTNSHCIQFEDSFIKAGLAPVISIPTHRREGCKPSCIDNILTSNPENVVVSGTIDTLTNAHTGVFEITSIRIATERKQEQNIKFYDYSNKNLEKFVQKLDNDLSNISDINEFSEFTGIFHDALDSTCKLLRPKITKRTPENNPWITDSIKTAIDKKHELKDDWVKSIVAKTKPLGDPCLKKRFTDYRRVLKAVINTAKSSYSSTKILENKHDRKKTWQIINELRGKSKKVIKPAIIIDNKKITDRRKLEKILINNKISVHKTFELQKSSDTGLVVNSKEEADFLIEKLGNELPEHKTSIVSNRIPTITIVGLERQFSSDELTSMIVNQNPGIAAIRQNASPEDNILDIVKVQPLRNNSTVFKAIVREKAGTLPNGKVKKVKFLLFNPRSLNNKVDKIMGYMEDRDIEIAGLCETWLTDNCNATTAVIKSYGYSIIHDHRGNQKGGGTAIVFKPYYKLSVVKLFECFKSFEFTAAILKNSTVKIMILIIYRTGPLLSLFNQELDKLLSVCSRKCDLIFLAGDLNIHFSSYSCLSNQTLDMMHSYNLNKLVNEPTHCGGSSLDQIFCSSRQEIILDSVLVDGSSGLGSDHFPVLCDIKFCPSKKYFKTIEYRNLKDIDGDKFSSDLNGIIDGIDKKDSFSMQVQDLTSAASFLLDEHAPYVTKNVAVVDSAPWFDSEYRDLRKERRRAEKKKKKSPEHHRRYLDLCDEANQLSNSKKKQYFKRFLDNSHRNPKTLYKMVNNVMDRKQDNAIPDTENIEELASTFNTFFTEKIEKIREKMTTSPHIDLCDPSEDQKSINLLHQFEPATIDEVSDIIKETGVKCSPADILPQNLYEENISNLTPLLTDLVNLSLSSGSMDGVKLADIVPIIKGENLDPNILKNYRPVSNLTFLGKIIERVVLNRLNSHLTSNNLQCPNQYAYKKNHSTETLMIKIVNDVLIAMDEKEATVIMLLDLSAAFDTVDHDLLLRILEKDIGLRGNVLQWFSSFLKGRSQRIRLGKTTSECITIKFGVPQGSVLGPVLFNLYIRSIYRFVQKFGFNIFGYADDHQILKSF